MSNEKKTRPAKNDQLADLTPKNDENIVGGLFREPTKHPAKVTVPDLKLS